MKFVPLGSEMLSIYSLLLIACACVASVFTSDLEFTANGRSQNVPLFVSNINKGPNVTNTNYTTNSNNPAAAAAAAGAAAKVPSRKSPSLEYINNNAAYIQQQQTPASVFAANYNNQQNVLQLARNIDERLRDIRNMEMRVPTIQKIFDSLHFSSVSPSSNSVNRNNSKNQLRTQLQQDIQIFSNRLGNKLQKATHIVLELREFLLFNLTKIVLQQENYEDDLIEESESTFDIDVDDDLEKTSATVEQNLSHLHLYLNTYIENCQPTDVGYNYGGVTPNYNKKQIQILNNVKPDMDEPTNALLNENNARSMAANTYVAEKLVELRNRLTQTEVFELPNASVHSGKTNSGKLKFLGNHYKHIYFLSNSDGVVTMDGRYIDGYFRQLYVSAIKNKLVLLLVDVGSALNADLLELTKSFIGNILELLSETDQIAVVTVAAEAEYMYLEAYPSEAAHGSYAATRAHKEEILNYVNNLNVLKGLTNHTLGFEFAFQMLHQLQNASRIRSDQPIEFIYVTRGLLTNLSDAMQVLRVVANGQAKLSAHVIINTCAVVLDEKRIMYEQQFLCDIAAQNYTKYDINVSDWLPTDDEPQQTRSLAGKCFVLTKQQQSSILSTSTRVFEPLFDERYLSDHVEVHSPVVETESGDVIVGITHAVPPFGVVGVNLYLADLIEDLVNYQQPQSNAIKYDTSYAFLIARTTGYTLAHPSFPRPLTQSQTGFPVDIAFLENATDFANIRAHMLTDDHGNVSTTVYSYNNRRGAEILQRTYYWQSILGIYVLCLVTTGKLNSDSPSLTLKNITSNEDYKPTLLLHTHLPISLQRFAFKDNMSPYSSQSYDYGISSNTLAMELLYHRLDLLPRSSVGKTCRYFRQLATFAAPTLFLSAAAFESPFTFLHNNRLSTRNTQIRTVESIMPYLKDSTGLIANPGLRSQIRNEVSALYSAMQHLKKQHLDAGGTLRNYIIRRYIATVSGVLQVYPGCLLSTNYDATRRPWFHKAMQQPGRIISTDPYLDAGGAGYIVTIAHTIFEGKAHGLHSIEHDQPVAIVAVDLPYAFYYKLILDTTPLCQLPGIKCLLFEHEGFLIAHPSMLEPSTSLRNQRRPHEHLTHKESYLSNDILNHKTLVRKLGCSNYQNRTLQRYYAFNTSLNEILTNVVHGERTKYAISLIHGSNIFAAVLNSSCDGGAFCPCSTIDRMCLNCKRMDQTDCECPCECPMELDVTETYTNYTLQYAYCTPPGEHFIALPPNNFDSADALPSCQSNNCDVLLTQHECLGVMGCEWCQQDIDGNIFIISFCTAQASCFNGVLGSLTPYGDLDDLELIAAHGYDPQQKPNSYSALGPVAGAIVVLALVIGFAIYCYRHNLDAHAQDQFYIDSMQEENYGLPLSRFNFDDCQVHDDPPGGAGAHGYDHAGAQRNLMNPADISPYHVSTGSSYRRPPNGESDHGYSTMTPHEDSSDHQCFTLAEPLLLHDKRHSKSDTMSISTSISSPTNRNHQTQTHPYLSSQPPPPPNANKDNLRYITPLKHTPNPPEGAAYEQTILPARELVEPSAYTSHHYILAPVTVHRRMEPTES